MKKSFYLKSEETLLKACYKEIVYTGYILEFVFKTIIVNVGKSVVMFK